MAADSMHAGLPGTVAPDKTLCSFQVDGRKFEIRLLRQQQHQPGRSGGAQAPAGNGEIGRLAVGDSVLVVPEEAAQRRPRDERDPAELLTARELQIASLVARGLPTKRIADMLHITDFTVATHLRRAYAKLNVGNRAAMVYRCASLLDELREAGRERRPGLG